MYSDHEEHKNDSSRMNVHQSEENLSDTAHWYEIPETRQMIWVTGKRERATRKM